MKQVLCAIIARCTFALFGCNNSNGEKAPAYATCSEKPDTGITCQAYFTTWFYDETTGKCEKIGYSGCEPKGFETEEECKECDCYRLEGK
mgnify:CR=1 FL=1